MKLIVACDPSGGIGYQNKLPWSKIEGDLPRFKRLTDKQPVIMGRNTWDSLPKKPLPNRINIVVTSNPFVYDGAVVCVPDIINHSDWYWLIGGAKLIESCWQWINEIHLTKTYSNYLCDTFIDLNYIHDNFIMGNVESHSDHEYQIWKRKHTL
jgi:dihydrofolate reductase